MPNYTTTPEWNDPTYAEIPYVHKVTIPTPSGGTATYYIRDAAARSEIEKLINQITGGVTYVGICTNALEDGDTTSPVTITGQVDPYAPVAGDIVIVRKTTYDPESIQDKEFIWNGTQWDQFGDINFDDLGQFAFANTGTATLPSMTASVNITNLQSSGSYTPEADSITTTGRAITTGETADYTPTGTIAFTTDTKTVSSTATATSNVSLAAPVVTPSNINISEVDTNTSVTAINSLGETSQTVAASVSYDATNETLIFTKLNPTNVTATNTVTKRTSVMDGVSVAAPAVTNGQFAVNSTGSVDVPDTATFTGDGAKLTTTFTGKAKTVNVSGSGTASGTVTPATNTITVNPVVTP